MKCSSHYVWGGVGYSFFSESAGDQCPDVLLCSFVWGYRPVWIILIGIGDGLARTPATAAPNPTVTNKAGTIIDVSGLGDLLIDPEHWKYSWEFVAKMSKVVRIELVCRDEDAGKGGQHHPGVWVHL